MSNEPAFKQNPRAGLMQSLCTLLPALVLLVFTTPCNAARPSASVKQDRISGISTKYFGPYAFPVPDLLDGRIGSNFTAELGFDVVAGRIGGPGSTDWTYAPTFRLGIPLWSERAKLSVWGEFHEFYIDTPEARAARGISHSALPLRGNDSGNLYFGIEIQALKEKKWTPSVAVRASTVTATGDNSEVSRHYDAPGYFFDVSAGKNFRVGRDGSFRVSATAGFVCWQIAKGTQNDALMLGARLSYSSSRLDFNMEYGQYKGREKDWAEALGMDSGDFPQAIKSRLSIHFGNFSPFLYFQYGLNDWPFSQFRAGLAWSFDLVGHFSSRKNR